METGIVEAMEELYEAGSAHMLDDAWKSWRRQHRQAETTSAAQKRAHNELLSRGLDMWLTAFQRWRKEQKRAMMGYARAMMVRGRFEARDEIEAMIHWVNHRRRRVPVPERYITYMRLKKPFRKWREYAAGRRITMDEDGWRTPEEHSDDDNNDAGDQGNGGGGGDAGCADHTHQSSD